MAQLGGWPELIHVKHLDWHQVPGKPSVCFAPFITGRKQLTKSTGKPCPES